MRRLHCDAADYAQRLIAATETPSLRVLCAPAGVTRQVGPVGLQGETPGTWGQYHNSKFEL